MEKRATRDQAMIENKGSIIKKEKASVNSRKKEKNEKKLKQKEKEKRNGVEFIQEEKVKIQ